MRVMLLLRSRPALLTTRRQLRQRRLNVFVVDLHIACSPPQGHTLSRKRTHPQPLRVAMRLHFPIELLGGRWCKMEPLRVRTCGSAAAPRAARSVMQRGDGPCAQPQSLCFSSSSSGGALDSGVRRRA